jgi:hypothetical protein
VTLPGCTLCGHETAETEVITVWGMMSPFSPELIGIMRAALEEAMTKVPSRQATPAIKASAEGLTMAAISELPTILSSFGNDAENADKWSTFN